MRTQDLNQAVITCLVANGCEMKISALVRQVSQTLPFPVHAKEISDRVSSLEQRDAVKKVRSSSGALAVVLRKEASSGISHLYKEITRSRL
ncbi:hypothetical protein [Marinococcus halophilus]